MTLLQLHVVTASAWMGLIAAEVVVELLAKDRSTRRFVAEAHRRIDLYFEGPLIAVVSNAVCIRWVVRRSLAEGNDEFIELDRKVSWTGNTIPFGVLALAIGLYGVR